jgi:hypothetical protein
LMTGPNGQIFAVGAAGPSQVAAPPELTDDDILRLDQGGPQASRPAAGF